MTHPTDTAKSEELKAVAYLYEREDGSRDLVLDCNGEYARRLIELGATETPLYANPVSSPPQNDAGKHWSRQQIVNRILEAITEHAESKGKVFAVAAGKAADDILALLAPALRTPMSELQALGQEFEAGEKECLLSPDGKHQVDTSMESGPNNCFHCEQPMPKTGARR